MMGLGGDVGTWRWSWAATRWLQGGSRWLCGSVTGERWWLVTEWEEEGAVVGSRLSVVAVSGGFLRRWWFYVVKTGPWCGSWVLVLFLFFFYFFFVGLNLYAAYLSLDCGSGFGGVLFWFWNCNLGFDFG